MSGSIYQLPSSCTLVPSANVPVQSSMWVTETLVDQARRLACCDAFNNPSPNLIGTRQGNVWDVTATGSLTAGTRGYDGQFVYVTDGTSDFRLVLDFDWTLQGYSQTVKPSNGQSRNFWVSAPAHLSQGGSNGDESYSSLYYYLYDNGKYQDIPYESEFSNVTITAYLPQNWVSPPVTSQDAGQLCQESYDNYFYYFFGPLGWGRASLQNGFLT